MVHFVMVQVCSLTMEHQVFQYVPNISISEQFEVLLSTIFQWISFLLLLILCIVIESSCLIVHNIAPHISSHDLPNRMTTKKHEHLRSMEVFQFLPRKFAILTWLCNCQQYLCLFHIVFECISSIHDQGKMLVLPNRLLYKVLSTSDQCFVSFQRIRCHPHTQIRTTLLRGVRISIPNWEPSPNRTAIGFSQIAFPITVLLKDDHADSAQEEQLGLPNWTMILAICGARRVPVCECSFVFYGSRMTADGGLLRKGASSARPSTSSREVAFRNRKEAARNPQLKSSGEVAPTVCAASDSPRTWTRPRQLHRRHAGVWPVWKWRHMQRATVKTHH